MNIAISLEIKKYILELKALDEELFKNKLKNLYVKDFRTRNIWTHFGDIKFKRRRYFDINAKKYRYLLDEQINMPHRKYVLPEYQSEALSSFLKLRSYSEVARVTFNDFVTKQSVCNFIQQSKIDSNSLKPFKCESGVLNINIDGIFIKKNGMCESNYIKTKKSASSFHIKSFLFFTDSIEESNERFKLQNRYMKFFVEETGQQKQNKEIIDNEEWISDELMKIISMYENVKKIRIVGDGARWIKNLASWLGATYCSDKFHIRKRLKDLVGPSNYYKALKILNQDLEKNILRNELIKFVASPKTGEISKESLLIIGYLINNHKSYLVSMKLKVISAIEGIQAHYIAKYFKRQRKCWSKISLSNIIIQIQNQFNTS